MKLVFPVGPVLYLDHRLELLVVVVGSIYERGCVCVGEVLTGLCPEA